MRRGVCVLAVALGFLVVAPPAGAYIYWLSYDSGNSRVGRAGLDGSGAKGDLVKGIYFGSGVASDGNHVYWGESGSSPALGALGRATTNGGGVSHGFLSAGTYCGTFDVKTAKGHVYWLKSTCSGLTRQIDRAPLNPLSSGGFVVQGQGICGFTVGNGHVYWSEGHYIGRAGLDGSSPNPTWLDVGTSAAPCGVAVNRKFVYWTDTYSVPGAYRGTKIGRASIKGTKSSVKNAFISGLSFFTGLSNASGIAVDDKFIYWTNQFPYVPPPGTQTVYGSIGRANLDGTGVRRRFVPHVFDPVSLAIDSAGPAQAPPTVSDPEVSPPVFHVLPVYTPTSARPARRAPGGTTLRYRLSEAASVTIAMQLRKGGRRKGGKCRRPTRRLKGKPKCNLTVMKLFRSGTAGANEVPFTGRTRKKVLRPGRYLAVFTAKGKGGRSKPVSDSFKVVAG
ncbi:MAG: hypothetical protein U0R52_04825 [Solirubrobacterales bacterium]